MARILITSGPTRQYLDPVRYLTNASSGRMGCALTAAALDRGHEVIVVSGPVQIRYPDAARVVPVVSTEEMLEACCREFPACDGLIATAAPCDYRPQHGSSEKISKTGQPLLLQLLETPDIVATLGAGKRSTINGSSVLRSKPTDQRIRAQLKLEKKSCDLIVLNGPQAIDSETNAVEVMDRRGQIVRSLEGSKVLVAQGIFDIIQRQLIDPS